MKSTGIKKKSRGAGMISVLKRAVDSKEKVQIMYMNSNDKLTQRYVTVVNINQAHAICYCHYRKQRRMFRLENILAASPLDRGKMG